MIVAIVHLVPLYQRSVWTGSAREQILENVGRRSTKAAGDPSKEIEVHSFLAAPKGCLSVDDVLRAAREALHGNEILATDNSKSVSSRRTQAARSDPDTTIA
jgi:hypothetical protein